MASLLFFLVPLVLLWVLLVRPQQQRMRQAQALVASLEVGDDVITAGGIYGTITDTDDASLWLEIAPGVVVRVSRSAVSTRGGPAADDDVDDDELDEYEDDDEEDDDSVEPAGADRAPGDDEA
jgi:preprotein translocase subunit YajC